MPKKKKTKARGSRKEAPNKQDLPGGFGRQVFALVLILFALLFVFAIMGAEGTFLRAVFDGGREVVGHTMYVLWAALVLLAVMIFRKPDHKLPFSVWFMMGVLLLSLTGLFGLGGSGGVLGEGMDTLVAGAVGMAGASAIYIFVIFVSVTFVCCASPLAVFRWFAKRAKKKKAEDAKNMGVMEKAKVADATPGDLKINAGVAMVDEKDRKQAAKAPATEKAKSGEHKSSLMVADPNWKLPPTDMLELKRTPADAGDIRANSAIIQETMHDYGVEVKMVGANVGPRVTQYTMEPASGVKMSAISALDRELALALSAEKIRIEAPIPGTRLVGVEVPNLRQADVRMREILDSKSWKNADGQLTFAVGKDISGESVIGSLEKMPHLLIAGTTGSGKSVMMNTLLLSLLCRNAPSDMNLILVDPKQVEMVDYTDIKHLITPIITDVQGAMSAMTWAVKEMDSRYKMMAKHRVKKIGEYNAKVASGEIKEVIVDEHGHEQRHDGVKMPYIVIVLDEFSDLIGQAGKDLESLIVRVAQKGRASGMHLVLATQRPEAKVITGLLKSNIPGRIAFAVGSQIDSRVMLDMVGAEKLLGQGDMLMLTTEMMGKPRRVQGAFAEADVKKITDFIRDQGEPEYNEDIRNQQVSIKGVQTSNGGGGGAADLNDPLLREIVEFALEQGRLSNSDIMRRFGLGFQRAGRMIDNLEMAGVIGARNGNKPRDMLIGTIEEFDAKV